MKTAPASIRAATALARSASLTPHSGAQAKLRIVGQPYRLFLSLESEDQRHRTKELFPRDRRVVGNIDQHRRSIKVTRSLERLTAREHTSTCRNRIRHLAFCRSPQVLTRLRTQFGAGQKRISDLQCGRLFDKCLDESIGDRLRNQKALGRNTTLCVVGVARSHTQLHRFRDIRILQHDERI